MEVTFFEIFFGQVWDNPGKIPSRPQEFACAFVYDNMATNPQSLTSSYRSRSFAACDCWTQTIHLGRKFSETV